MTLESLLNIDDLNFRVQEFTGSEFLSLVNIIIKNTLYLVQISIHNNMTWSKLKILLSKK